MSTQNPQQSEPKASSLARSPFLHSLAYSFDIHSLESLRTLASTAHLHITQISHLRTLLQTQSDRAATLNHEIQPEHMDLFSNGLRDAERKLNECIRLTDQVEKAARKQFDLLFQGTRSRTRDVGSETGKKVGGSI
ncbi:MAG: hypothetical protein LQ341_007175 [Variospora aurantia]|nr:MAG: hypothetical protein LQ341_007175 [Variospora aurantia]